MAFRLPKNRAETQETIKITVHPVTPLPEELNECFTFELVDEDGSVSFAKKDYLDPDFQLHTCSGNGDYANVFHSKVKVQMKITIDHAKHIMGPWERLKHGGPGKDVALTCSDGFTVMCHRIILRSKSAVFSAMLYEEDKDKAKEFHLPDCPSTLVEQLIQYLYTGQISNRLSDKDVMDLLQMADKYMVDDLKRECVHRLYVKADLQTLPALLVLSFLQTDTQMLYDITKRRVCDTMTACQGLEDWARVEEHPTLLQDLLKTAVKFTKKEVMHK